MVVRTEGWGCVVRWLVAATEVGLIVGGVVTA